MSKYCLKGTLWKLRNFGQLYVVTLKCILTCASSRPVTPSRLWMIQRHAFLHLSVSSTCCLSQSEDSVNVHWLNSFGSIAVQTLGSCISSWNMSVLTLTTQSWCLIAPPSHCLVIWSVHLSQSALSSSLN